VALHPIEQAPGGNGIRLSAAPEVVLDRLRAQSEVLADPVRYARAWDAFCEERRAGFLTRMFGFGKWLQRLNRRQWMFRHLGRPDLLRLYNLVSCESHRSALRTALDGMIERQTPPGGEAR